MTQLRTINKAIAATGFELVKGEGYFYFIGGGAESLRSASVYVPRLNDLSLERWVEEATNKRAELDAMPKYDESVYRYKLIRKGVC